LALSLSLRRVFCVFSDPFCPQEQAQLQAFFGKKPRCLDGTRKTLNAFVMDKLVDNLQAQVEGGNDDTIVKDTLCLVTHYRELTK
jgi:hypothetical protein